MTASFQHFGIIGAGAWGTALAVTLQRAHRNVTLWTHTPTLAATLAQTRDNTVYLPGVRLESGITPTAHLDALSGCDALILAAPAQYSRELCKQLAQTALKHQPIIIAAKGIELVTHRLQSEIVAEILPGHPVFVLSGPSFATEVAKNLPAALTLAGETGGEPLARAMSSAAFRLYTTDDIIGTQIGGALKNVIAIACGIVIGKGLGDNARAALMTRSLAEIMRLGTALGARPETLMGLSGLGDIALSCAGSQSRNLVLGVKLGQGLPLNDALKTAKGIAEGVTTATAAIGLAYRHGVEMPVTGAIDRILRGDALVDDIITELMARPLRQEAA